MNGELPLTTPPKVAVILIGTNDVGATESCLRDGDADLETAAGTNSRSLSPALKCHNKKSQYMEFRILYCPSSLSKARNISWLPRMTDHGTICHTGCGTWWHT